MMPALLLAAALVPPDAAPLRTALDTCDRGTIAALTTDEPRRRAAFSSAAYEEQRAIAAERARLDGAGALAGATAVPAGAVPAGAPGDGRAALDARQRRLDDARGVERAWRESLEDSRAAFLALCAARRDGNRQP